MRAVTVQKSPASGISSRQALKAMERIAARALPAGYAGERADTAFREKRAEGKTTMILGFAVRLLYLFQRNAARADKTNRGSRIIGSSPNHTCCRHRSHSYG